MKITVLTKQEGRAEVFTVADAPETDVFMAGMLKKARENGYIQIGQKFVMYNNILNVTWSS
jgi:hypothetical protein